MYAKACLANFYGDGPALLFFFEHTIPGSFCSWVPGRMYLQTKLANPHFKPEVAAQTTLVNFCVTEIGLEEQLLALVRS